MANTANATLFIGFLQVLTLQNDISTQLIDIIKSAREERYFNTIIYMSHTEEHNAAVDPYNVESICCGGFQNLLIPMLHLQGNTSFYLRSRFNREIMALVPLSGDNVKDKNLLESLWMTLRRNHKARLLLLSRAEETIEYLAGIMKFCYDSKVVNIMAIKASSVQTQELHVPKIFPKFEIINKKFEKTARSVLYSDHLKNMHGHSVRLGLNKANTNAYVVKASGNDFILGGHVGHFFEEFAKAHNATVILDNRGQETEDYSVKTLEKMVENGIYDMSTEPSFNLGINEVVYSDTYDYLDWCIMVPMEKSLPAYMFYARIFNILTASLIISTSLLFSVVLALTFWMEDSKFSIEATLVNIYIFNGLLGQSFKMEPNFAGVRSFLYMLICIGGLIFNTSYVTYLQTFNTHHPKERDIKTFDDIRTSGMKVAFFTEEFDSLKMYDDIEPYRAISTLIPTYREFHTLRDNFDIRYMYPVPSAKWSLYEQQQKFFSKPRFRLSDICFVKGIGLTIPMQPHSLYEEAINLMIGQLNQGGLVSYWKSLAFLEAVQMKRINLLDVSTVVFFEPMKLEDTALLVCLYVALICVSCLCFFAEVYWPRRGLCGRKLLQKIMKINYI